MSISLPVAMAEAKESGSAFFIELYKIELPSYTLYLCNADQDIDFAGQTFLGYPIERGEITKTVDSRVDNCDITISNTNDYFTLALLNGKNFLGCRAWIGRILYPDSLSDPNLVTLTFYGQIDSPELQADGTFKCSIVSDIPNMDNCRTMNYTCSNKFGDDNCRHSIGTVSGSCTISTENINGVDRQAISSDSLGSTYWKDAIITIDGLSRRVISYTDNKVYVEYAFPDGIDTSNGFTICQNCDKTPSSCDSYNNRVNYGGFLFIPFEFSIKT